MTVRAKGGRGGRNTEFLLGLAVQLNGAPASGRLLPTRTGSTAASPTPVASSPPTASSVPVPWASRPTDLLAANDAWSFFDALGDLVTTGPTLTNVNDFRAILVER